MPSFAPNFQYPEDIPHVTGDRGTVALAVRKDVAGSLVSTDGDYSVLQVDDLGRLKTSLSRFKNPLGVYYATGRFNLMTLAHLANAGFVWLLNPLVSGRVVRLRRVVFTPMPGSSASMNSAPRIQMERMLFTGVAAGVPIVPAQRDSTESVPLAVVMTTAVGIVIVPNLPICSFVPQWSNSLGTVYPVDQVWEPEDTAAPVVRPGEGVVWRQHDAGSSPETRTFTLDIVWEEI